MLLLILVFLAAGCSQRKPMQNNQNQDIQVNNAEPNNPEVYASIKDPIRKIHNTLSIVMPSDWKEIAVGTMITYLPKDSEAADPLSEKVVVVVSFKNEQDVRMPLKEMAEKGINDMKSMLPDITLTSQDETAKLAGLDAIKFIFTASIQGKMLEYTQINAKKNNIVYGIMHSCIKGECKYTDIYNDMVSSFKTIDYIQT
jgi:PBP1b-binding outer membrane lipoprotein LpoB